MDAQLAESQNELPSPSSSSTPAASAEERAALEGLRAELAAAKTTLLTPDARELFAAYSALADAKDSLGQPVRTDAATLAHDVAAALLQLLQTRRDSNPQQRALAEQSAALIRILSLPPLQVLFHVPTPFT